MILFFYKVFRKISQKMNTFLFSHLTKNHFKRTLVKGKIFLYNRKVKVGKNVTLNKGVMFMGDGEIVIGDNCNIGSDVIFYSNKEAGIFIGNDTAIGARCYIIDSDHSIFEEDIITSDKLTSKKIEIGCRCWLGTNVIVLKGSTIEDDAIVGAMSLVKTKLAKKCIYAGVPCSFIKRRPRLK